MKLEETARVVVPDDRTLKRRGEGWAEILRRWLVECPRCAGVWLVVGARQNDRHVCRGCGHAFDIRLPVAPGDNLAGSAAARKHK